MHTAYKRQFPEIQEVNEKGWILSVSRRDLLVQRIRDRSRPDAAGCWIWQAAIDRNGYGYLKLRQRRLGAHRASWLAFRGQIPPDLVIDHMCRVRACVNPDHLRLLTNAENVATGFRSPTNRRRDGRSVHHSCRTHDRQDGYLKEKRDGYTRWVCRICARANAARFKARHAA